MAAATAAMMEGGLVQLHACMAELMQQEVYESAELLGNFLISAVNASVALPAAHRVQYLMTYARSLSQKGEHARAISYYRQALQSCEAASTSSRKPGFNLSPMARDKSPESAETEAKIKLAIARCHLALNSPRAALAELETVTSRFRTLPLLLTLGKLYRINGYDRASVSIYKECIRLCPYAMEALVALAELGVKADELNAIVGQHLEAMDEKESSWFLQRWLSQFLTCHLAKASNEVAKSADVLRTLLSLFPNNVHLLLELGHVHTMAGDCAEAVTCFQHARTIDGTCVAKMDHFAAALNATRNLAELNRLTHDLLRIDNRRPETWVSAALYWEAKGDKLRALSYAEKGLRLDDTHAMLHVLKGNLCLKLNRPDSAVSAFLKAQTLEPGITTFQGLTRAYVACGKHKEALVTAREAVRLMPQSSQAVVLLGTVYASQSDARERAIKLFEGVLERDPNCKDAVMAIVDTHTANRNLAAAERILSKHLESRVSDELHARLGGILLEAQKYGPAMEHYHIALSLNENNEEAQTGLDRLEKLMKGIDPDMVSDDDIDEHGQANADDSSDFM